MSKMHENRLTDKYGLNDVRGKKYQELMNKIIANNSKKIQHSVSRITERNMRGQLKHVKDATTKRPVTLVFPEIKEILPKDRVLFKKAAEDGKLITTTLKNKMTQSLRQSIKGYEKEGKRYRGRLRPEMIRDFKKNLKTVFEEYVKTDPKYGVPTNIHTIAVTEMRTAVNEIRSEYVKQMLDRNPDLMSWKVWIHNRSLSKVPRKGHAELHNVKVPFDKKYNVKIYDSKGRQVDTIQMDRPHDPTAPAESIIGCNCEQKYLMRFKSKK